MTDTGKQAGNDKRPASTSDKNDGEAAAKPDWADGLKQFYDSVVDEPLPNELAELLSRFDDGDTE